MPRSTGKLAGQALRAAESALSYAHLLERGINDGATGQTALRRDRDGELIAEIAAGLPENPAEFPASDQRIERDCGII